MSKTAHDRQNIFGVLPPSESHCSHPPPNGVARTAPGPGYAPAKRHYSTPNHHCLQWSRPLFQVVKEHASAAYVCPRSTQVLSTAGPCTVRGDRLSATNDPATSDGRLLRDDAAVLYVCRPRNDSLSLSLSLSLCATW